MSNRATGTAAHDAQLPPNRRSVRSITLLIAAIALAAFAATRFAYANVIWDPAYYGQFGLSASQWTNFIVRSVVPGSPADKAGIKPGDKIVQPPSIHERLVLSRITPRPGERITLTVLSANRRRSVTLEARPLPPLAVADRLLLAVYFTWLFTFVAVSFALLLLRPSKMTWGFFLFPLNLTIIFSPSDLFFSYLPTGWFLAMRIAEDIIAPAGIVGFLIFCLRFPTNAPAGWRRAVEKLAPFIFLAISGPLTYWDLVNILIRPVRAVPYLLDAAAVLIFGIGTIVLFVMYLRALGAERQGIKWILIGLTIGIVASTFGLYKQSFEVGAEQHWPAHATLLLATIALLITYFEARGLERQRIKWVVLGVICAWIADGANHLGLSLASLYNPKWFIGIFEPLYVALPLAVAYAVIKHRVIDVRFVVSRSLTFGIIAVVVGLIVFAVEWLFSSRLPNSHWEAAAYLGVAILIGFSLNTARQTLGNAIDVLFFPKWHRARQQAAAVGDALRRAASKTDLYEPLTAGIADAFFLTSVALFEPVEGGGFVRVAARGWLPGKIWHILPDDPLLIRAGNSARPVDLDALEWQEPDLPLGAARPVLMVPIASGKRQLSLLLLSAHEDSTGLAPDEIGAIHKLCAEAGFILREIAGSAPFAEHLVDRIGHPLRA